MEVDRLIEDIRDLSRSIANHLCIACGDKLGHQMRQYFLCAECDGPMQHHICGENFELLNKRFPHQNDCPIEGGVHTHFFCEKCDTHTIAKGKINYRIR